MRRLLPFGFFGFQDIPGKRPFEAGVGPSADDVELINLHTPVAQPEKKPRIEDGSSVLGCDANTSGKRPFDHNATLTKKPRVEGGGSSSGVGDEGGSKGGGFEGGGEGGEGDKGGGNADGDEGGSGGGAGEGGASGGGASGGGASGGKGIRYIYEMKRMSAGDPNKIRDDYSHTFPLEEWKEEKPTQFREQIWLKKEKVNCAQPETIKLWAKSGETRSNPTDGRLWQFKREQIPDQQPIRFQFQMKLLDGSPMEGFPIQQWTPCDPKAFVDHCWWKWEYQPATKKDAPIERWAKRDEKETEIAPDGSTWSFRRTEKETLAKPMSDVMSAVATPSKQEEEQHQLLDLAKTGDFVRVREHIEQVPDDVNVHIKGRYTLLHQACYMGDADMVQFLIDHGAHVTLAVQGRDDSLPKTPKDVAQAEMRVGGDHKKKRRQYRKCISLIDVELLKRSEHVSIEGIRKAFDLIVCTGDIASGELTPQKALSMLTQKLGVQPDVLEDYKEGLVAELDAAARRMRPVKPTSIEELKVYYLGVLELAVETEEWRGVETAILDLHQREVTVPMLKMVPRLRTYIKNLPEKVALSQRSELYLLAAERLCKVWQEKGKRPPAKCSQPQLDGATDQSLTLTLKVPSSETELTAIVIEWHPFSEARKRISRVPNTLWQGKAPDEEFTWTLQELDAATEYVIGVRAVGSEECWQRGIVSKETFSTLSLTSVEELKSFNKQLGDALGNAHPDTEALLRVLGCVRQKHATREMIRESSFITSRAKLHKVIKIEGEVMLTRPARSLSSTVLKQGSLMPSLSSLRAGWRDGTEYP